MREIMLIDMKRNMIIIITIFSIVLMVSTATAVPTIQWDQQEKAVIDNKNVIVQEMKDTFKQSMMKDTTIQLFVNIIEKLLDLSFSIGEIIKILITILFRWPIQGLINIFTYAFIENSLISTLIGGIQDLELTEKFIVIFTVLLRWPIQGLINIFTYAFIENSFISSLISLLQDSSSR